MDYDKARFNMVEQQIRPWDVLDFDVLDALSEIPREHFVPHHQRTYAYADKTLTLPNGGSMLEPKIVARLVQGLSLQPTDRVLEIGTGSGYATALLAALAEQVTTIDIDAEQQACAKESLATVGVENVSFVVGDGLAGDAILTETFDAIYLGGSVNNTPEILKAHLKDGGRMVVVVGDAPVQRARLIVRKGEHFVETSLFDTLIPKLYSPADRPVSTFSF